MKMTAHEKNFTDEMIRLGMINPEAFNNYFFQTFLHHSEEAVEYFKQHKKN